MYGLHVIDAGHYNGSINTIVSGCQRLVPTRNGIGDYEFAIAGGSVITVGDPYILIVQPAYDHLVPPEAFTVAVTAAGGVFKVQALDNTAVVVDIDMSLLLVYGMAGTVR